MAGQLAKLHLLFIITGITTWPTIPPHHHGPWKTFLSQNWSLVHKKFRDPWHRGQDKNQMDEIPKIYFP